MDAYLIFFFFAYLWPPPAWNPGSVPVQSWVGSWCGHGMEISVGVAWHGETGIVCLAVVCVFQVGFGFDFRCLTVVMGLISSGFWCEFFFSFLWVSIHGGGGCVVAVDLPWLIFLWYIYIYIYCVVVVVVYLIFCVVAVVVVDYLIFCVFVGFLWVVMGFLALVVVGFLWQRWWWWAVEREIVRKR